MTCKDKHENIYFLLVTIQIIPNKTKTTNEYLNPLTPERAWHLISPNNITPTGSQE